FIATLPKSAYVSLIADVPANRLYSQFGFDETAPRSVGMARRVV
ncbi:MAG: GNAT family N-acetyltransferase, partial [Allorhizobium sp.]